MKRICKYNF